MEKYIYDIGCGKYKINTGALFAFLQEWRDEEVQRQPESCSEAEGWEPGAAAQLGDGREVERIFDEVMQLYREYGRTGSMDVLVNLKCRLEEVSLRYRSVALAEEVLSINSCLPYERRVPHGKCQEVLEELRLPS